MLRRPPASCVREGDASNITLSPNVERAETLVCLGEISAARHALEGSPVAPGTQETLNAVRDMDRRSLLPRDTIPEEIRGANPSNPLELDKDEFLNVGDCTKFFEISQAFAQPKLREKSSPL